MQGEWVSSISALRDPQFCPYKLPFRTLSGALSITLSGCRLSKSIIFMIPGEQNALKPERACGCEWSEPA